MKKAKQHMYAPALILAAALFFYSASTGAPQIVFRDASHMLASAVVSASASVAPNAYNSIAAQLSTKENELTTREKDIAAREELAQKRESSNISLYSLIASVLLALLVAINFYFDWRRDRERRSKGAPPAVITLHRRG